MGLKKYSKKSWLFPKFGERHKLTDLRSWLEKHDLEWEHPIEKKGVRKFTDTECWNPLPSTLTLLLLEHKQLRHIPPGTGIDRFFYDQLKRKDLKILIHGVPMERARAEHSSRKKKIFSIMCDLKSCVQVPPLGS